MGKDKKGGLEKLGDGVYGYSRHSAGKTTDEVLEEMYSKFPWYTGPETMKVSAKQLKERMQNI
jgi:hypothetical protein